MIITYLLYTHMAYGKHNRPMTATCTETVKSAVVLEALNAAYINRLRMESGDFQL